MPAVGITDHGSMAGAIELYRVRRQGGHQAAARLRDLPRRRPPRAPALDAARLEPPHAAGRDDRGLPQPHQALHARLPRGLLLQAARRLLAARAVRRRDHRALRLPLRAAPARRCSPATRRARARSSTASCRSSGARTSTSSCRTRASTSTRASTPACCALAAETGLPVVGTGDVHYLRAEDADAARGAALHPDQRPALEPEALPLLDAGLLPQDARRDEPQRWRPGAATRCSRRRSRSPSAATSCSTSTASTCRASTRPATTRSACCAGSASRAWRERYGDARRRSSATASSSSSRRSARWASPTTS